MKRIKLRVRWLDRMTRCGIGGLALVLAGCIVIPMDRPVSSSRQNVTQDTLRELSSDVMTKEQVILRLGEPDRVSTDGRCLGYTQSRLRAVWLLVVGGVSGGGYAGGMMSGGVTRDSIVQLTFDDDSRLIKSEYKQGWNGGNDSRKGDAWEEPKKSRQDVRLELASLGHIVHSGPAAARTFKVAQGEATDQRLSSDRIGEWFALGFHMGDIRSAENMVEFLQQELRDELMAAGHRFVSADQDFTVDLLLTRCWVTTKSTLFSFDVIAQIECTLSYVPADATRPTVTRHYTGSKVDRWYVPLTEKHFAQAVYGSIGDLLTQVRHDDVWQSWPVTAPQG